MTIRTTLLALSILFVAISPTFIQAQHGSGELRLSVQGKLLRIENVLSQYIQIPSVSGQEREAGEFLKQICIENNLYVTQMGEEDGNYNFSASIRPLSQRLPNIILLNHLDVVPAGDLSKWTHPPYSGKITEKDIWGRGTFDNKGPAIMQLFSIIKIAREFEYADLPFNITFLSVSSEENQAKGGAPYVVENYLDLLNPEVVIGEGPTSIYGALQSKPEQAVFGISVGHKQLLWLQLELDIETSGHGSVTPELYANKEMVKALNRILEKKPKAIFNDINVGVLKQLGQLEKGITSFALKHPRLLKGLIVPKLRKHPEVFSVFTNSITLTSLNNEDDIVNTIPEKVTAKLDCRLLPEMSVEDFIKKVKKGLKNVDIKIKVLNEGVRMEPSKTNNQYYIYLQDAIKSRFPDTQIISMILPSTNDSGRFRAKGIPAFTSIPILIEREYLAHIHNYNERIPLATLEQGQTIYTEFLRRCLLESKNTSRSQANLTDQRQ